jgi:hypothetical protein
LHTHPGAVGQLGCVGTAAQEVSYGPFASSRVLLLACPYQRFAGLRRHLLVACDSVVFAFANCAFF